MKKLKLYLIEFNENGIIIDKTNLSNCAIRSKDYWPVIIIIYNKYTFLANDNICITWTKVKNTFLYPKS